MENTNQQNVKSKKTKKSGVGKWIAGATMGLFASAIVGLSVALYYSTEEINTHETYQRQMEAVYSRAYYDLLSGANDLGTNLRKLSVSSTPAMQQSLLYEVWSAASLAENNLGVFDAEDEGMLAAQKFVNQLGDYSHSLALKVADGEKLTSEDRTKLRKMGELADVYKEAIYKVNESLKRGGSFVGEDGVLEEFASAFNDFTEPSIEYPEMIYDGPFSDALETREPVALQGDEMTLEQAKTQLLLYLKDRDVENLEYAGEADGQIKCYNFSFVLDGDRAFAQVGRFGGALILMNATGDGEAVATAHTEAGETCQISALNFAKRLGFDNMQVVWSCSAHGECVVNLAPVENDVILYSDLVKVKIRERDGKVVGVDATHYAFNHRTRNVPSPKISESEARRTLSLPAVGEGRLALIPLRGNREVLTYEFECQQDGTYFVYVDATTGNEANILYVIDDTETGQKTV
ncbi:MAG: germination protein YpeB [Clostridia bacterium]|nr:germination protein YpeB [Clostridia bacterium]